MVESRDADASVKEFLHVVESLVRAFRSEAVGKLEAKLSVLRKENASLQECLGKATRTSTSFSYGCESGRDTEHASLGWGGGGTLEELPGIVSSMTDAADEGMVLPARLTSLPQPPSTLPPWHRAAQLEAPQSRPQSLNYGESNEMFPVNEPQNLSIDASSDVASFRGPAAGETSTAAAAAETVGPSRSATRDCASLVSCASREHHASLACSRFGSEVSQCEAPRAHKKRKLLPIVPCRELAPLSCRRSLEVYEERHPGALKKANTTVFADANAMKDKIRQAAFQEPYDVKAFYHDDGIAQRIARSHRFEKAGLLVIFLNCVWIPVDIDVTRQGTLDKHHPLYLMLENFFCAFFFFEWLTSFIAFKSKMQGFRNYWFLLDSVLVPLMIFETWIMWPLMYITNSEERDSGMGNASVLKLVRMIKLTRMLRMARLLRTIPEVMILIKGLAVAARSVLCTICLLAIIIYFFAIFFTELTSGTDLGDSRFQTVMQGMKTLLLYATLPDLAEIVEEAGTEHFVFAVFMMTYILLATLTVMNMLIGVLVEVVGVVSAVEIEELACVDVKTKLQSIYGHIDRDESSTISRREFEGLLMLPEAARTIQAVGVDVVSLIDFADLIFPDNIELSFGDFMELVLQFRGSNTATVRDVVELRKFMMIDLDKKIDSMFEKLSDWHHRGSSERCVRFSEWSPQQLKVPE